jgi:hypothetical protein
MHLPNIRAKKYLQVKELTANYQICVSRFYNMAHSRIKARAICSFFLKRNKASFKQGNPKRDSGTHLSSPIISQVNHSEICALLGSYAAQEW